MTCPPPGIPPRQARLLRTLDDMAAADGSASAIVPVYMEPTLPPAPSPVDAEMGAQLAHEMSWALRLISIGCVLMQVSGGKERAR